MTPGQMAQVACLLEASARKAGNVHRFRDFDDCSYLDFALSAQAIGPALDRARSAGVGAAVLAAIEATRQVSTSNTNLGMILLLAPMAAASQGANLREEVSQVLQRLTLDDAKQVYQAIRLANPGGLGQANEQDVEAEPTASLLEAMSLAKDRDLVARQYANGYVEVFDIALPALSAYVEQGRSLETAIIGAHLHLLARVSDTLIARKLGSAMAVEAMNRADAVLRSGWPENDRGAFEEFDAWLRSDGHKRNPGATADLVAAALFAALWSDTIRLPMTPREWSSR